MGVFSNVSLRTRTSAEVLKLEEMRDEYLSRVLKLKNATIEHLRANLAEELALKIKAAPDSATDIVQEALGLIITAEDAFAPWTQE